MFNGFTDETLDFMWGIRFNNEKAWFEAHKPQYLRSLYGPMKELGHAVYAAVAEAHKDLDLQCKISRIYKDARRLNGSGPYRDHLWFSMEQPAEEWTCLPTFWFEFAPEGNTHGMGYYAPKALTMAKFRRRLDTHPEVFEKLVRGFNRQKVFVLEGEDYKRPRGETSPLLAPWYNKKVFSLVCSRKNGPEVYSPDLPAQLAAEYLTLVPLYRYFISLDSDPDPREP